MQDKAYDHLIIGSTPLAGLTAGLLARHHRQRVCLLGDAFSTFGIERRFDLTVDLVTRPETLTLLKRLTAESIKVIRSVGQNLLDRVDALFIAEAPESTDALSHFRHLAQSLDYPVERVADRAISAGSILRVRAQSLIAAHRFAPAMESWLAAGEVRRLDPNSTTLGSRRDGTVRVLAGDTEIEAAQVTLCDDSAVFNHLPAAAWDRAVVRRSGTALMLQPTRPHPLPFSLWLDRGLALRQEPHGPMAACLSGDRDTAEARVASVATRSLPLRRAGEARFDLLATSDGAPLFAPARGIKVMHLVNFGHSAAFFAPALARQLVGTPSDVEAAWFAAHGPTRGTLRLNAAEFA